MIAYDQHSPLRSLYNQIHDIEAGKFIKMVQQVNGVSSHHHVISRLGTQFISENSVDGGKSWEKELHRS